MPLEEEPNSSRNSENEISEVSVTPSREQQWREIVGNPAPVLPVVETPQEIVLSSPLPDPIAAEYTLLHRWVLITALTLLLILLGQGVAGDSSTVADVDRILQR